MHAKWAEFVSCRIQWKQRQRLRMYALQSSKSHSNNHINWGFVWHAHRSFGDVTNRSQSFMCVFKSLMCVFTWTDRQPDIRIQTHAHMLRQMISIESYFGYARCVMCTHTRTARRALQTGWTHWLAGCLCINLSMSRSGVSLLMHVQHTYRVYAHWIEFGTLALASKPRIAYNCEKQRGTYIHERALGVVQERTMAR